MMKGRTVSIIIVVVVFVVMLVLGILSNRAKGQEQIRLSREGQIEIMKTCMRDAILTAESASSDKDHPFWRKTGMYQMQATLASAFFQYRTKDR